MADPWVLAIDFGTSYTIAAVRMGDRPPEVIDIAGARRVPSVILAEESGQLLVGDVADELASAQPSRALRAPKNRLGDAAPVVLGGRPYQVEALVAALLRTVYEQAVQREGGPPREVRLTHPAMWNRPRLSRLLEAAAKAGITHPILIPEPEAAAMAYASEVGVPEGAHVAVYDLGGGTFDSAVVTAERGAFRIVGRPGGDSSIGGELFDELLANEVGNRLDPAVWEAMQVGDDTAWRQASEMLRRAARRAKETLSAHPYADVVVPLPSGLVQVRVTRDEYEDIVRPYVEETVVLLGRSIEAAGLTPAQLAAIYLVGGASRAPIVERLVRDAFPGVAVSRRGDPKTATAFGATLAPARPGVVPAAGRGTTEDAAARTADEPLTMGPPPGEPLVATAPAAAWAPPPAPPGTAGEPAPVGASPPGRRRGAVIAAVIAAVVALVVVLVLVLGGGGDDAAPSTTTRSPTTGAETSATPPASAGTTPPAASTPTTGASGTSATSATSATSGPSVTSSSVTGPGEGAHVDDLGVNFGDGSFVVGLGPATYSPDAGTVVMEGTAQNNASVARSPALDSRILLLDRGNAYVGRMTVGGEVAPGQTGAIQLTFSVAGALGAPEPFSFDTAEILVGDGWSSPSRIRLGDGGGIDHEPVYPEIAPVQLEASALRMTVKDVVVVWGTGGVLLTSARPGEAYLQVHADYEALSGTVFAFRELRLVLPDGTVSAASDSDPFDPILAAGTDTATGSGTFWFPVPEPVGGRYVLRFQDGEAAIDVPDVGEEAARTADLGCERSIPLPGSTAADVTFRLGRSTYHVCSAAVDGPDLTVSARVTSASLGNTAPETGGLSVRVGDDVGLATLAGTVIVPAREAEAVNAVLRFTLPAVPLGWADAVFVAGSPGDVSFEVPVFGSGEYHLPQTVDLDVRELLDFGAIRLDAVRVQTALDSRQATAGTYVIELDFDIWNASDGHVFLGRISHLTVPGGTSVDPATSGSKDFDLQLPAESQAHHATFVFEVLGSPGGPYDLTIDTDSGPIALHFDLPQVLFSPA